MNEENIAKIKNYIRETRNRYPREAIDLALINNGYSRDEIETVWEGAEPVKSLPPFIGYQNEEPGTSWLVTDSITPESVIMHPPDTRSFGARTGSNLAKQEGSFAQVSRLQKKKADTWLFIIYLGGTILSSLGLNILLYAASGYLLNQYSKSVSYIYPPTPVSSHNYDYLALLPLVVGFCASIAGFAYGIISLKENRVRGMGILTGLFCIYILFPCSGLFIIAALLQGFALANFR